MLKNMPCKVTFYSESKTGKHGGCKCTFIGRDIFTNKDVRHIYMSSDTVQKPIVTKIEYTCTHIDDGFMFLVSEEGEAKEDLKVPSEDHLQDLTKRIEEICEAGKKACLVTVQKWGDKEQVCAVREGQ